MNLLHKTEELLRFENELFLQLHWKWQTFQLCDLKMREILVIVIYKGGDLKTFPPWKIFSNWNVIFKKD